MRLTIKRSQLAMALVVAVALSACGTIELGQEEEAADDAAKTDAQSSMVMDAQLNEEGVSASLTDALEAMADSFGISAASSASLSLGELGILRRIKKQRESLYSKSCELDGSNAVVSVEASIDRSRSFASRVRSADWSVTGSENITRTWSKEVDDAAVQVNCDATNKYADIDWKGDLTGLNLDVSFERSREVSLTVVAKLENKSFSAERQFSAKGERSISWDGQLTSESGGEITRSKSVTSNVDRTHYRKNSKGEEKKIELNIKTEEESPLVIETVRNSSNFDLVSKNIKSGVLVGTRAGDGHIEATFSNLVSEFSEDECHLESGEVLYKLFKEGESEPAKSYKLLVVDGEISLVDVMSGEVKADFEFENCDVKSFQE
jgi:hypothetical protein